jgi:hypothetical protein
MNALRAKACCGGSFSIDMNALQAIAEISRRETISIERYDACIVLSVGH